MANWHPRVLAVVSWMFPAVAIGVGVFAVSVTNGNRLAILIAATLLIIGSLIGVATSNGGNRFNLGIAVAAAVPFVLWGLDGFAASEPAGSIAAYSFGLAGVWVTRHSAGESHSVVLPVMVRRYAGYVTYGTIYAAMRFGVFPDLDGGFEDLLPFTVALLGWLAAEVLVRSLLIVGPRELSRSYLAKALLNDANVFLGLALTGGLFGELYSAINWWAAPIALIPYAFAHSAFTRFQDTKTTYRQTIRALARIPEVSGLGVDGHADRTTELSLMIGRRMGLGPNQIEELRFAGLMHDIGRVSLSEPQILKMGFTNDDIARWSAEIIAESAYLEDVARLVRNQYEPYRRPGEHRNVEVALTSRVIKVASAYDWLVHRDGMSPLSALEELHAGVAYEYDPEVVNVLRSILDTRGVLKPVRIGQ